MNESKFNYEERRYDKIISLLRGIQAQVEEQGILKKDVLDFDEACTYLRVSDSFLYKKTSSGEIPFTKPTNGKLYFQRESLDKWRLQDPTKSDKMLKEEARRWLDDNINTV